MTLAVIGGIGTSPPSIVPLITALLAPRAIAVLIASVPPVAIEIRPGGILNALYEHIRTKI